MVSCFSFHQCLVIISVLRYNICLNQFTFVCHNRAEHNKLSYWWSFTRWNHPRLQLQYFYFSRRYLLLEINMQFTNLCRWQCLDFPTSSLDREWISCTSEKLSKYGEGCPPDRVAWRMFGTDNVKTCSYSFSPAVPWSEWPMVSLASWCQG